MTGQRVFCLSFPVCRSRDEYPFWQAFHRFWSASLASEPDERFQFFLDKVLPQYRDGQMTHTMLLVPSYFDFVRLRNHFIKETVNFAQVCEYTKVCAAPLSNCSLSVVSICLRFVCLSDPRGKRSGR